MRSGVTSSAPIGGARLYGASSERDWNCYMVCGLGGMFRRERFCIGADFFRKVFDHDMDVDTKYVSGSVGNANWMLRAYVGYES